MVTMSGGSPSRLAAQPSAQATVQQTVFKITITDFKADTIRNITGSVRALAQEHLEKDHQRRGEFKEGSVDCNRERGEVFFYNIPKAVVAELILVAKAALAPSRTFKYKDNEIEDVTPQIPATELLRATEDKLNDSQQRLAETEQVLARVKEERDSLQRELARADGVRAKEVSEVNARLKEAEARLKETTTKLAALEEQKSAVPLGTAVDQFEKKIAEWPEAAKTLEAAMVRIFGKVLTPEELTSFIQKASMDRLEYLQQGLQGAGLVIQVTNIDALLHSESWESSALYVEQKWEERLKKAKKAVEDFNTATRLGMITVDPDDKVSTAFRERANEAQATIDEHTKEKAAYHEISEKHREVAIDLDKQYKQVAELRELIAMLPKLPLRVVINREDPDSEKGITAEVIYPALPTDSFIRAAIVAAIEEMKGANDTVTVDDNGRIHLELRKGARGLAGHGRADIILRALESSTLQRIGFRFDTNSEVLT